MYMGIDQSFQKTGIVIINDADQVVHYQIVSSSKGGDTFEKAWEISLELSAIAHKFNPESVGVEGLAFSMMGNVTRDLAGLQYTIINQLRFIDGFTIKIIPPLTVKKMAGNGRFKKQDLVNALPKEVLACFVEGGLKKSKGLYDATDAYFIAKCLKEMYASKQGT